LALVTRMNEKLKKYVDDEYSDYVIYRTLATHEDNDLRRRILVSLSEKEYEHYKFWEQLTCHQPRAPSKLRILLILVLRRVLGLVFMAKLLERHERDVIRWYHELSLSLPPKDRETLFHIIKEEEEHERVLLGQIEGGAVRYLGFIALGLADAIIEVSGVHAGFLGATNETLFAGMAGLVVGFAASISMGAAAYIQAKQMHQTTPVRAATVTGVAYISTVVLQALPYFLTRDMLTAFASSMLISMVLMSSLTYYGAVIRDEEAKRELLTNTFLILAVVAATFFFGEALSSWLGIRRL